jgi:hypothetical protein
MATKSTRANSNSPRRKTRSKTQNESVVPSSDRIRERAYQIYLERGASPGGELADWLQAERELCLTGGK